MPKMRKVGGEWRTVADRYRKVDGVWRKVVTSYRKIDGVWVKVFGKTYLRTFVENADKTTGVAQIVWDATNNAWVATVDGVPAAGATVRVGVIVDNIPDNSEVLIERRTQASHEDYNRVVFTSNGVQIGALTGTNPKNYNRFKNVSGNWSMFVEFKGGNYTQMSFTLFSIEINGEEIPLN